MGARRSIGLGAAAGVAAYALLSTGVLATGSGAVVGTVGGLFRTPSAAAATLPTFDDCDQLRRWYVDQALPHVGPYGFGGGPIYTLDGTGRESGDLASDASGSASAPGDASREASGTGDAVGSSDTGTNVQEAGVDEADVAKTDGDLLVRMLGQDLVVTDVSGDRPVELSRTRVPGPTLASAELLLQGDRVLVVGAEEGYNAAADTDRFGPMQPLVQHTLLLAVDLSDPERPAFGTAQEVTGHAVSVREHRDSTGGTVRVVVSTGYPDLDFVTPRRGLGPLEATRRNQAVVRAARIEDWLPSVSTDGGSGRPLLDCDRVRHPRDGSGFGTLSVLTFGMDDPAGYDATAITAAGELAYSSTDRLYVATVAGDAGPIPLTDVREPSSPSDRRTEVHAFALDGRGTSYLASGTLSGTVKDRWSFDEHEGRLRVAVEQGRSWDRPDNAVVVLEEDGGRLRETGRVEGLGRNERIQSVRWFGDLAVVVTFRQTDPLYTVDLSDPDAPRVMGALKVPGFSSYLHPVGDDRLVGVGRDATESGQDLGGQVATFDLSDLADVRREDTLGFGPNTDLTAGFDPRAFAYLPEQRTLITPVADWTTGGTRFVAVRVGDDGSLRETGSWVSRRYDASQVRTLPLGAGRVALAGDVVRLVDVP